MIHSAFEPRPPATAPTEHSATVGTHLRSHRTGLWCGLLCAAAFAPVVGCSEPKVDAVVFYCDGAGWYSGAGPVAAGLRRGGYQGDFRTFSWSAFLGPGPDHLIAARSKLTARRLSGRIERARWRNPEGSICVMGLSAGTAVALSAVEQLSGSVQVDHVVLLSASVSANRNLTPVMKHVRGYLYATSSLHDGLLRGLVINADGGRGPPAGRVGFRMPREATEEVRQAYRRVINLTWHPAYLAYDWDGGHTSVTHSPFIAAVIAPRILSAGPFPLDRSIMDRMAARTGRRRS
ncbi:MAG: hypothetical protein ACE5E1_02670 [Phycisphaerae bacterium]